MFQLMRVTSRSTSAPSSCTMRTPSAVTSAMSPSCRMTTFLVCSRMAGTSLARNASPRPEPHDQRHVHARSHDPVGMGGVHDADGVRAAHPCSARAPPPPGRRRSRCSMRCASTSVSVSEVNRWPAASSRSLISRVVLDDPVVDQRQLAAAVAVRMGVGVVRAAVGRPAGVRDARVPGRGAAVQVVGQVGELAGLLLDEHLARLGEERRCRPSRSRGTRGVAGRRAGSAPRRAGRRSRRCRTWAPPWLLVQARLGELVELTRDLADLVQPVALDHDPEPRLRARGPDQDPSPARPRRASALATAPAKTGSTCHDPCGGRPSLASPAEASESGRRARRASVRRLRARPSTSSMAVSIPSPVVARSRKMMWPDCSPPRLASARSIASNTWRSPTGVRSTRPPAASIAGLQAAVAHDGRHQRRVAQRAGRQHLQRADAHHPVAVDQLARPHRPRSADRRRRRRRSPCRARSPTTSAARRLRVAGAGVEVDVGAVGLGVDDGHARRPARGTGPARSPTAEPLAQSSPMRRPRSSVARRVDQVGAIGGDRRGVTLPGARARRSAGRAATPPGR